jgi:branched-chain amino acid transport system ATP-binding protein
MLWSPRRRVGTDPQRLTVDGVTVRFGGITALDDVSFTVEPGTIHAIIGPNGAGKSTCFNVLSGVYRATHGSVRYGERQLTRLRPHQIASLGVGRAFQNIALSGRQSVAENLLLGRHHLTRAGFTATGLGLPHVRREQRLHYSRIVEIAEFFELDAKLAVPVGQLSYGDQKRVEMARAVATEPSLLLLDEPVAGMNSDETQRMARTIVALRAALSITVVLVEHDMGLVMGISDRITVLDFGRRIADGPPALIRTDPAVVRAYLGEVPAGTHPSAQEASSR